MPIPPLVDAALPPGRHRCTERELFETFVEADEFTPSLSRAALWEHWQVGRDLLRSAVKVHCAWISGSFTTAKMSPRDIDVTFIISESDRRQRSVDDLKVVESFITRVRDPLRPKEVIPAHGLMIDSYVINWAPHHPSATGLGVDYCTYAQDRGYWDDWWSRQRRSGKGKTPTPSDAVPRRGYLEVIFDDFE